MSGYFRSISEWGRIVALHQQGAITGWGGTYRQSAALTILVDGPSLLMMALVPGVSGGSFDSLPVASTRCGICERNGLGARQRTWASGGWPHPEFQPS